MWPDRRLRVVSTNATSLPQLWPAGCSVRVTAAAR